VTRTVGGASHVTDQSAIDPADSATPTGPDGPDTTDSRSSEPGQSRLVKALLVVILVAAVVAAGAVGWVLAGRNGTGSVSASSVDAGFARDMSTHHTQAVKMAGYVRLHTTNASVLLLLGSSRCCSE